VRLARYGEDNRTAVVVDDGLVDVSDLVGDDWAGLITKGVPADLEAAALERHAHEAAGLRPPLASPAARVFALGVNFRSHVSGASAAVGVADPTADTQRPPAGFFVIPGTLAGHDEDVAFPPDAQKLDYEAEVAAVLATGGRNLDPAHVRFWGHTAFNDLSVRDPHLGLSQLDKGSLAWGLQKNFQGGNVCGPWIAIGEHPLDDLAIRTTVNGELRQEGSTAQMIHSFAAGAAYLSRFLELRPGDMITSGTPGGTAIEQGADGPFLQRGDVVEVTVEGAGVLRTRIV
jgi:2-keto-4-pentenoate hydratase/2-oxohepta-3-ene-1,7-dioic acid hydratase in catechol pathway